MIITCAGCGAANSPGDTFCASCSAFLEWEGTAVPNAVAAPRSGATVLRDASLVPVTAAGVPTTLDHQTPQEEATRPAPRRAVTMVPASQYCGSCGAGNTDHRRFCRTCGAALEAQVDERPGWVDRFVRTPWRAVTRRGRPSAAGDRPTSWNRHAARERRRRWSPRMPTRIGLGRVAIPLMVLSLCGFGLSPMRATATTWLFHTYASVKHSFAPEQVDVKPAAAASSSSAKGHRALSAVDQNLSTYWMGRKGVDPVGTTVTVDFAAPTDLSLVGIVNGAPGQQFARSSRLRTVQIDATDAGGKTTTARLEVGDTDEFRTYPVNATNAVTVTMTVLDVYPGQATRQVSLTEISFHVLT